VAEHHILLIIRTEEPFIDAMTKAAAGARGLIEGQIEAHGVDPGKNEKRIHTITEERNEATTAYHDLKNLLRKVLEHADIGHIWNIHEHCQARYDRGPCTCGLAELEKAVEEATK
jgi:hypothetical protein